MVEPAATEPSAALTPSKTVATPGERFPYEVRNTGPGRIGVGEPYRFERLLNGAWQRVDVRLLFRLPLYLLPPGGSRTLTAQISDELAPGHYRLLKEIRAAPAAEHLPPASDSAKAEVSFEFDVIAAES